MLREAPDAAVIDADTEPELSALQQALEEIERHAPLSGELAVVLSVIRAYR